MIRSLSWFAALLLITCVTLHSHGESPDSSAAGTPEELPLPEAQATTADQMQAYDEVLEHTELTIAMVPVAGGTFVMGSPEDEADRKDDEPQHTVTVGPFWMGKYEITWDQYDAWGEQMDQLRRQMLSIKPNSRDLLVDGISKPTEPYTDMSFGMGKENYPAICMTQHAARTFCAWLSAKTGRYYRLPTEAEWEFAARGGTTTAYSFGDDPDLLDDHAWYYDNSDDAYHEVGGKAPNPLGLYDMHGNVAEWVLDQYDEDYYSQTDGSTDPLNVPKTLYPRIVRGGGWDDDADMLRSAAREGSSPEWKAQDPQLPQSIWYHTDAQGVGFRVVRPLNVPTPTQRGEKWDKCDPPQLDQE